MIEAPPYEGVGRLIPCDGRELRISDYPNLFRQLQDYPATMRGMAHFSIPDKPQEVSNDIESYSVLIRKFYIHTFTGDIHIGVRREEANLNVYQNLRNEQARALVDNMVLSHPKSVRIKNG